MNEDKNLFDHSKGRYLTEQEMAALSPAAEDHPIREFAGGATRDTDVPFISYGHPRFYEIIDELKQLHSDKNHDYAGDDPLSNLRACERTGLAAWKGVVIRLQDKFSRLENFMVNSSLCINDESMFDTLNDIAVYSILCRVLMEEEKKNEDHN